MFGVCGFDNVSSLFSYKTKNLQPINTPISRENLLKDKVNHYFNSLIFCDFLNTVPVLRITINNYLQLLKVSNKND